ncbi:hypothetical protein Tco_1281670 [Tanacetum coccineum]
MRIQTQAESDVAVTKRRHGNHVVMQVVLIPKAKPDTVFEISVLDHPLILTPEFGPGVTPGARLTRAVYLCAGIISCRVVEILEGPISDPTTPVNRVDTNEPNDPPNLQEQILNHISSLKALVQLHNESPTGSVKPIRLSFDDEEQPEEKLEEPEDLRKPYKEVLKSPFSRRIIEFSAPNHRTPTNLKIYDGSTDPDDHITHFVGAANQGEWEMPVWCQMFQQTLDGPARGWFDRLPNGCIDN